MTKYQLLQLLKVAEAATTGRWYVQEGKDTWVLFAEQGDMHPKQLIKAPKHSTPYAEYWPNKEDSDFMVTFNPQTVIKLINELLDLK